MEAINVYREAIKRTFADVYQVLPETIEYRGAMTPSPCAAQTVTLFTKSIATTKPPSNSSATVKPCNHHVDRRRAPPDRTRAHHLGALTMSVIEKPIKFGRRRIKTRAWAAFSTFP